MQWIKNMSVGLKLSSGFALMILVGASIGLTGYLSVRAIQNNLEEIFATRLPAIDYLIETDRDLQQLLVAERSMIFTNTNSDTFKDLVAEYETNLKQADERWEKYKALASTPGEREVIPVYEKTREEWKAISRRVVDGRVADTREGRREALDLSTGAAKDAFEKMRDQLDRLTELNLKDADTAHEKALSVYRRTASVLFSIIGFGILAGIILMWALGRGITRPLKRVIAGLNESAEQIASASGQVSSSSQVLASGSSQQAASIEETSSSLEEMSAMTRQNADNASQADNLMNEAKQVVGTASSSMAQLTAAINDISRASDETSKIIKTIDEIAFQTNLLALNAAVEAARAGEAGAGFAVVADEVRNLAMRAAEAAKSTAELIEGTVRKVGDGSELVTKTNDAFAQVAESAQKVAELVSEISAASTEQAEGIGQVNTAVTEMDKVVQQNAASAEESASASEEMTAQAENMKAMVRELVALVGGRSTGDAGVSIRQRTAHAASKTAKTVMGRKERAEKTIVTSAPRVSPAAVIPLDDSHFNDF